ncbi:MAG: xanthine dehydrogenase family protein molybdopterin-binding subunit [Bacteroidales bacterium]|nr:xanthine dehydrogenase family protein molybdopterin-binding subunit [Bacteroidales bacterium]MBK7626096.1 xanthine dehydrogenase family protein molybdopterin-binding subunit [Bacteroidales bacterium]
MKKDVKKANNKTSSTKRSGMPRRDFFKLLGSGIIIFFRPWGALDLIALPGDQARSLPKDYNSFLSIAEDGTVTCFTGKIEMGQGIITSLPQMMADELNVPLEKVKMVMGDTDLCPWDGGTWGSLTTRAFGPAMRAAAAEAKAVLLDLASVQLGVPVAQLEAKDGIIIDTKNPKNTVSYSQLAKGKRIEKFLDVKPTPEDYTKFYYVGKSYKHSDASLKVTGAAKYTGDLKLPGMVYARILRPPSHGAKLTSVDYSAAEKLPGVKVIRDGDLVAVLHENREKADAALATIKAEYSFNEMPVNDKTVFEWMLKADSRANVVRSKGDLEAGRQQSEKVFESEYHDPYLAHAPMETHTALAQFENGKMTVWAATQTPYPLQDSISRDLGLPLDKVRVIVPFVGGGFGGKSAYQQGNEAAKLAKLSGKPVMVMWTRDEEFFYDNFHSAAVIKIKSGIDKEGMIKLWDYHVYYAGTRGSETIYDVPNNKTTDYSRNREAPPVHPFSTGPWRAPNANTNTFAREVQIDIMASAAGIDPLEFRLKNLKDEKMIACLKSVADKFGYVPGKSPSGRGIGVACGTDAGTWVAHMAEVKVDKATGKVTVVRIACSQDMGLCVNPQGATIQMEGCIMMALGYTFTEELFFEGGKIIDRGFDTYEIPKFSWLPKIDTVILDRKDKAPQGGGEPAIVSVGAVIASAIFDATGARLYRMPMTPARVLEALKKA